MGRLRFSWVPSKNDPLWRLPARGASQLGVRAPQSAGHSAIVAAAVQLALLAPLALLTWSGCTPSQPAKQFEQDPGAPSSPAESAPPAPHPSPTQPTRQEPTRQEPTQQEPTQQDAPHRAATPVDPQSPPMFRRERTMMGTIMLITVVGQETPENLRAVEAAFAEMARLEAVLSEWQPDSEISKINQAAGKHPVAVSEDTLRVVSAGLEVSRWSEGAFDLSWAALRNLYLFQPGEERIPSRAVLKTQLPLINYRDIELNRKEKTVRLRRSGMKIGTGGIAKGYALDRAGQVLQNAGVHNYMLFGGGQVQVKGARGERPWRVGIQHPRKNDYFAFLAVEGGSISTSGDYEHAFMKDGQRWHHLLDLKTGLPVRHTVSVTVLADSGLYADALSTAFFALGAERATKLQANAPGHARFVLVDADLQVHAGGDFGPQLVFTVPLGEQNSLPQ